jgi:NhaP-type Na+/H+ or K+/H+ antiporter
MTYAAVIFSIMVQGLTVGELTAHFVRKAAAASEDARAVRVQSQG